MVSETEAKGGSRFEWIDIARGLSVLLVMVFHSSAYLEDTGRQIPGYLHYISDFVAPYRIPMLFFLSGIFLPRSMNKGLYRHVAGKLKNIAWPYVIWGLLFIIAKGDYALLTDSQYWQGGNYLWFLIYLFTFFMFAPFVNRIPYPIITVYALAGALLCAEIPPAQQLFVVAGFFFLGAFAGEHMERFTTFLASKPVRMLMPFALGLAILSALYGPIRYQAGYAIAVLIGILYLLSFLYRFRLGPVTDGLQYIGRNSIVFYASHVPLMPLIEDRLFGGTVVQGLPLIIIYFVSSVLFAILMTEARKRSSLLAALFVYPTWLPSAPQSFREQVSEMGRVLDIDPPQPPSSKPAFYNVERRPAGSASLPPSRLTEMRSHLPFGASDKLY